MLIILSGLPATGKSTIARALAVALPAIWLRIDDIEQALREVRPDGDLGPEGYVVAYAVARRNLRLGQMVIADSVNPIANTREAWHATAAAACVGHVDIEILCSDAAEHRRRAEAREVDIAGLVPPSWPAIRARHYEDWVTPRHIIDTAGRAAADCVAQALGAIRGGGKP